MDESNNGKIRGLQVVPKQKLTVKEIKEIEPKADVYELNPHSRYVVMIKKSMLAGGNELARQKAQTILQLAAQMDIPLGVLVGVDDDVKFIELEISKK